MSFYDLTFTGLFIELDVAYVYVAHLDAKGPVNPPEADGMF